MLQEALRSGDPWIVQTERRGKELLKQRQRTVYQWADQLLAGVMFVQYIAAIAAAFYIAENWAGAWSHTHLHVWLAVLLGGAITSLPILLAIVIPGTTVTRHVIAAAQMLMSALLIHLSGGRIETHFHVFGSLAILAFYRDWKVLLTATTIVTLDHFLRGMFWPESVFGVLQAGPWRWVEHAAWVAFEVTFLLAACRQNQQEMRQDADQRALLESRNEQITLQKHTETTLLASTRAKNEFLANMSHEIRTPMTAILGYAEILQGESGIELAPPERIEAIASILRNGEHLLKLINDILDISKIEAGKLEVERIACSPMHVLQEVIALTRTRAMSKNVDLTLDCVGGLPESIQSDPLRLRQILINLVGNAIKFTEAGSVRVVARLVQTLGNPTKLQVEVIDTGIGLSQQQVSKLFRPFSQADSSTTRKFGGTGLGLTISKRLAEMLGGHITVSSVPGGGSTFCLIVDTGDIEGVTLLDKPVASTLAASLKTAQVATKYQFDCRILLAEDGPDNQRLITFILRKSGADVTLAENGQIAVEQACAARDQGKPFDLFLMDMQMPIMDGYTAVQRLRELGHMGPILALTAHAMPEDRQKCLSAGCDDYLTKPIMREQFLSTIARYLAQSRAQPGYHVANLMVGTAASGPESD